MNPITRVGLCASATLSLFVPLAVAQQPASEDRMNRLEERLDQLERQHQTELKQRDDEIAKLRQQVEAAKAGQGASESATTADGKSGSSTSGKTSDLIDQIDGIDPNKRQSTGDDTAKTSRAVAADAAKYDSPYVIGGRHPVSFNPDIAVITDFVGSYSTNRDNDAFNRYDVREVELDLRAAVHPNADAVAILAFERDVENPVFPELEAEEEGLSAGVSVEEAYLFLHDFGVPNLTAKLGRYHLRFGRQNILHLHDLPTSDPPLVNQAFLAPEALVDSGLSLSYVIPPKLVGNQYVEIITEVLAGEGGGAESPTFRGDIDVDSPAFNTHLVWNRDIAPDWNLELGASWLNGHATANNSDRINLYGGDITLIHTDPTGGFSNQLFQAEAIYGNTPNEDSDDQHAFGFYVLGQQQINRDLYAGVRFDYTQNPADDDQETYAVSPYVSYYWSEFLRFRVEYQHKEGDVPSENTLFFQATWIFGAHPPHPYWAMR